MQILSVNNSQMFFNLFNNWTNFYFKYKLIMVSIMKLPKIMFNPYVFSKILFIKYPRKFRKNKSKNMTLKINKMFD